MREKLGCRVRLEVDPDDGCGGYLQRAGFFRVLPTDIQLPATVSRARLQWMEALEGNNPGLIELTPIVSDQAISDVLDRLERVLRYRLHYPKHDAFDLLIVFSELCNNILDHNSANCYGLAAMQVYNPPSGRFMQFVVADRGAGIAATLRRNPRFTQLRTDADGIVAALELGASEHEESTRGNGLYHLLELSFKHGGTIHIRSGTGKAYLRMDQQRGRRFNVPQLTGTQFSIAFPDRRRKTG
jgi:anti-sigma regulatory factor (Ser/Thr protein kinase)